MHGILTPKQALASTSWPSEGHLPLNARNKDSRCTERSARPCSMTEEAYPGLIEVEARVPSSKVDDDDILCRQWRQLRKDVVPEGGVVAPEAAHMNLTSIPELHIRPADAGCPLILCKMLCKDGRQSRRRPIDDHCGAYTAIYSVRPSGCGIGCDGALLPGPHARGVTALRSTSYVSSALHGQNLAV